MYLTSSTFKPYQMLDSRFAFGKHNAETHFEFAGNVNPQLTWHEVPADTRSLVIICVDQDAPTLPETVNVEGESVDVWQPRADFFHWVHINLPSDLRSIDEGSYSDQVSPKGKSRANAEPLGGQAGLNHYTYWFKDNEDMNGDYYGYDGPAPPWNDERVHGYRFQVHALDIPLLDLPDRFFGGDAQAAMVGHVLATAELIARYAINPAVGG